MTKEFLINRITEFIMLTDQERKELLRQIEIINGIDSLQYIFYDDLNKFVTRHGGM